MNKYAVLAIGVAAGLVVAPVTIAANAEFNPGQVCNNGAVDAKFALEDYRAANRLYDRADHRLQVSASRHQGRPTKGALGVWRHLNRQGDRLVAEIHVNPITGDLEWCSAG